MSPRVDFPQFELVGPACEVSPCSGVLTDYLDLESKDYFQRCSLCKGEFNRMPAAQKLAEASQLIESLFLEHSISETLKESIPSKPQDS